jgi:hypothetical protein
MKRSNRSDEQIATRRSSPRLQKGRSRRRHRPHHAPGTEPPRRHAPAPCARSGSSSPSAHISQRLSERANFVFAILLNPWPPRARQPRAVAASPRVASGRSPGTWARVANPSGRRCPCGKIAPEDQPIVKSNPARCHAAVVNETPLALVGRGGSAFLNRSGNWTGELHERSFVHRFRSVSYVPSSPS